MECGRGAVWRRERRVKDRAVLPEGGTSSRDGPWINCVCTTSVPGKPYRRPCYLALLRTECFLRSFRSSKNVNQWSVPRKVGNRASSSRFRPRVLVLHILFFFFFFLKEDYYSCIQFNFRRKIYFFLKNWSIVCNAYEDAIWTFNNFLNIKIKFTNGK